MVRPSNPRFMSRVLEAVTHLSEGKGSSARDVLTFVRQNSSAPARNLTMQVHRALKHAVNAGLLRLKSGRYKALVAVNPIRANLHRADDANSSGFKVDADTEELPVGDPSGRIQERRGRKRRRSRRRRRRSAGRRRRRSRHRRRTTSGQGTRRMREARRKGVEEEVEEWAVPRRKSHVEDLEEHRARKKGRRAAGSSAEGNPTYSDDSVVDAEYEDGRRARKSKGSSHSPGGSRRRRRRKRTATSKDRNSQRRTGRRSSSRHRSEQQLPLESTLQSSRNGMECDDEAPANFANFANFANSTNNEECRNKNSQEQEIDPNGEPENCASGSDL